ncbi:hypothetical protein KKH13_03095 [Patescibacteria group bacterium]|nr:hypothetical protein [Patescibacteria group bacterium]
MIISICASLQFVKEMRQAEKQLQLLGHQVLVPKSLKMIEKQGFVKPKTVKQRLAAEAKHNFLGEHFRKIKKSEAILVVNPPKNGIKDYIGGNTFLEMGVAFYLGKPIYLMYDIPKMDYELELQAMKPIVLHGDLTRL